jgi:hypothetical protein
VAVVPVILVPVVGIQEPLVKDLGVALLAALLHMPVAAAAEQVVQEELGKVAMLVKAAKVDK